ncbi:MAG: hypothetical protein K9N51_01190, partial [Candidatus Pacebacteria bacterium]|nr:hypothetical protein [Candidatus Paceibacterota bacterium]
YTVVRYGTEASRVCEFARQFLREYPDHYLADDVLGWQARTVLGIGDKQLALDLYLALLVRYPAGDMVNSAIESILGIDVDDYRDRWRKPAEGRLFESVRALYRPRLPMEGPERLLRLLENCEKSPELNVLVPEVLAEIVKAGRKPVFSDYGDGTEWPWRYELLPTAESTLLRLVREFPWQRDAAGLALNNLTMDALTADELLELLRYSVEPIYNERLIRRYTHAMRKTPEVPPDGNGPTLLGELPAGPSLFARMTQWDLVEEPEYWQRKDNRKRLRFAEKILDAMDSIPMDDDERRLYLMLRLRIYATQGHSADFVANRDRLVRLGLNTIETAELAVLDGVLTLKTARDSSQLKEIIRNAEHPYRITAGRILAASALEKKDYPLLIWTAFQCDVYDAFVAGFANVTPAELDDMLSDQSGDFAGVRRKLFLRRALWAVLERDLEWLRPRRRELLEHCREWPPWLPEMVEKIERAQQAVERARTPQARHEAEYRLATVTYGVRTQADLSYDCFRRLKNLEADLGPEENELRAKCLYTMGTSLQNLADATVYHCYYSMSGVHLGPAWLGQNKEVVEWSRGRRMFLEIADLYERVANECPHSTLADDALYWAAYNCKLYASRSRGMQRRADDPNEADVKARGEAFLQRIRDDYPDGDTYTRLDEFTW